MDCLANQFLARCLVVQNRLAQGKSEEYEKYLTEMVQKAECQAMNPQESQNFLYKDRSERVKKVLEKDNELLERLQDLPYLKIEQLNKLNELQSTEVQEQFTEHQPYQAQEESTSIIWQIIHAFI